MPYCGHLLRCSGVAGDIFRGDTIKTGMASNFDRATIFHFECSETPVAYMTETEFVALVMGHVPDIGNDARDVILRCYRDISPFDVARQGAYDEARICAVEQIRARQSRARVLMNATRSVAPAGRSAPMASMSDRREGAEDVGEDDGLD
tara:strand:- start:4021 stop:4467 length:447 start_codon:yes stop_codon:yes gene_type:complete